MNTRLIGIDVARSLSVIGMILVNFKVVLGDKGAPWLENTLHVFDGKAAATFVVLAGVGIALLSRNIKLDHDKWIRVRKRLLSRSVFLFVLGLLYHPIWPADILHYYGVYMVITLLFLKLSDRGLLALAVISIFSFPILLSSYNYELGWNFETFEYSGFWTVDGFFRNLFFNGFHPVIPWVAFMLFGVWLGRKKLDDLSSIKKIFWSSLFIFILIQVAAAALSSDNIAEIDVWSKDPMPPLPLYMFNGMSMASLIITGCIWLGLKRPDSKWLIAFSKTGQLALTFYVAHVIIGMGMVEVFSAEPYGSYPLEFSASYALVFSLLCILFAQVWLKKRKIGPVEWVMRKLTF